MLRAALVLVLAAPPARADSRAITDLEAEIESVYGDLHAGKPNAVDRMRELRVRAEHLTGEVATPGIDASLGATITGSKRRVLTGRDFAVVVDRKNQPVAWFAVDTPKSPCPPCSGDARTVVARAASPRLVEIEGLETGPSLVVDLTTLDVRVRTNGDRATPSPDGKRLALVGLSRDELGTCSAQLTIIAAGGRLTSALAGSVPPDMCQGDYEVAWRGGRIIVTSDWSEDYAVITVKTGAATTVHGTAPMIRARPHRSRPLRARVEKTGCTVDGRFVFPDAACE